MNSYQEMQERHQQEVNQFPFMFAFSNQQFDEGMRKLGLDPSQTDQIVSIGGGGYVRKSDVPAMREMFARQEKERKEALATDKAERGHAYQMFLHELGNHEYCVTLDLSDTLVACGVTHQQVNDNENLRKALSLAIQDYMKDA